MKKILILLLALFAFYQYIFYIPTSSTTSNDISYIHTENSTHKQEKETYKKPEKNISNSIITAYNEHRSDIQVNGSGHVIRILKDDLEGSRHQKFILRMESGQTLLIAHNIDLAPKILNLSKGDSIDFFGEYVWNHKGGLIHWTHHDPKGNHVAGWLKHNGRIYQ